MSMSLTESGALMRDPELRDRIKVAALKYAIYAQGQPNLTPSVSRWVQSTTSAPDQAAMQLQPLVVMDDAVQSAGKDITDESLQTTVETVIKKVV